jgi:hypothetical protein
MRRKMSKNKFLGSVTIAIVLSTMILATFAFSKTQLDTNQVYLQMKANKDSYILGEPIHLIGEYINDTDEDVLIYLAKTTVISVAKDGQDFKWFDSEPTNCSISRPFLLKAKQAFTKIDEPFTRNNGVFLLNAEGEAPHSYKVRTEKIVPNFAFQDIGTYYAKYGAELVTDEKKRTSDPIRTEPVKITITEPMGDDLEVWKIISGENKSKFTQLMRSGGFYERDEIKKTDFIKEVEQILADYPNSIYSSYLRNGIDNFKKLEIEKKRK